MALFYNNGTAANSFSPVVAADTFAFADLSEPGHLDCYYRVGGALALAMGLALRWDIVEPKRASGGGGTAGATKAITDGNGFPDCFGRQAVIADAEDTDVTTTYKSWNCFVGVFTGKVMRNGGGYGRYNMPSTTPTVAYGSVAAANTFTHLSATTTPCADPLNDGGSYAMPGDIIVVRRHGPCIAWVSDVNATAAGDMISFFGAGNTPQDGTFSIAPSANPWLALGTVVDEPTTYAATGAAMGCRIVLT